MSSRPGGWGVQEGALILEVDKASCIFVPRKDILANALFAIFGLANHVFFLFNANSTP
jgi:hypothetical protein